MRYCDPDGIKKTWRGGRTDAKKNFSGWAGVFCRLWPIRGEARLHRFPLAVDFYPRPGLIGRANRVHDGHFETATVYLEERKAHVSERTTQFEKERLGPLTKHFGDKPLLRFKAEDVVAYQTVRLATEYRPEP